MMKKHLLYIVAAAALLCACNPTGDDIELALTNPDQAEIKSSCDARNIWIDFDCNRSWKASATEDWIEIDPEKGPRGEGQSLKLKLAANGTYQYRTAEVTIEAGDRNLVVKVTQEPILKYYIQENFNRESLLVEEDLPSGWYSIDADGDGYGWRCVRDSETDETFAYSASFLEDRDKALRPENWMVTPRFVIRDKGFSVKWDVKGSDADYLGDKYQVWVATYENGGNLVLYQKICEEVTTSATELKHHEYNLDLYTDLTICIAFKHLESYNLSSVLITNIEVSNK